jgi:two-component system, OmpR family, KDP operon response regulator KdpE
VSARRVLVCDDEPQILRALRVVLREAGFEVAPAATAQEALDRAAVQAPDAAILDLVLPDGDGIEVCRSLREWSQMPIILLSAVGDEDEKVRALEAGADDYVVKPFALTELLARIEAVMRRAPSAPRGERLEVGALTIDFAARTVAVDGAAVALTRKEFDLLAALARAPGATVDRQRLLLEVWHSDLPALSRTLDVHVATLRAKLGRPDLLQTVRGVGYRLAEKEPPTSR